MIQSSRLPPLLLSALFALALVAEPLLPSSLQASEEKKIEFPAASQHSVVKQRVGLTDVEVDYSRPNKNDREIFGGLVPYGKLWRTGANAATQFRTDKALAFGGTLVPAGFYTLWTLPAASGWKLIVNSETGQWGTAHKSDKDLFSIDMKIQSLPQVVERFTISVDSTPTGGVLNLDWDTTRASAAFTTQPSP